MNALDLLDGGSETEDLLSESLEKLAVDDTGTSHTADDGHHWTAILTMGKKDVFKSDSSAFDANLYCDVPWEFQVNRLNAPGLVGKDPVAALSFLRDVYQARTPSGLNWTLWNLTFGFSQNCHNGGPELWSSLAQAGFFDYLQCVVGDSAFFGESLYWVLDILRQLHSAFEFCASRVNPLLIGSKRDDHGVLHKSSRAILALCSNAWKNQDTFLRVRSRDGSTIVTARPDGKDTATLLRVLREEMGSLLLTYRGISIYDGIETYNALVRSPEFQDVHRMVLHSWFINDDDDDTEYPVNSLLVVTALHLDSLDLTSLELTNFSTKIFDTYGPPFLARFAHCLLRPHLNDEIFLRLLVFGDKVLDTPEFRPHFESAGMFQALLSSFNRQAAIFQLEREILNKARIYITRPLIDVLVNVPAADGAIPLIRELDFIKFLADSMVLAAGLSDKMRGSHACAVNKLAAYGAGLANRRGNNALGKAFSDAVRQVWYPTLIRLLPVLVARSDAEESELFVRSWRNLGVVALLEEEVEKAEYEREKKSAAQHCAWMGCHYHTVKPPTPPRVCQGCGEARYCSRECQSRDWKEGGHKAQCRRLKGVPRAPRTST